MSTLNVPMGGGLLHLRRVDDSDHASLAVAHSTAVVPNRIGVVDGHREDGFLQPLIYFSPWAGYGSKSEKLTDSSAVTMSPE